MTGSPVPATCPFHYYVCNVNISFEIGQRIFCDFKKVGGEVTRGLLCSHIRSFCKLAVEMENIGLNGCVPFLKKNGKFWE